MDQAVSRRPVTKKFRVQSQVSPCQICERQSATGTGLYPSMSVLPSLIILTMLHTHLYIHVALARMASGQDLGTFRKTTLFQKSGSMGYKSTFTFYRL